jgi:natural product precursor
MKTQKSFSRRLKLSKETIAQLGDRNMNEVKGGDTASAPHCCCNTTEIIVTNQNPCPVPFTEAPISVCC